MNNSLTATLTYATTSYKKMNLIAKLVRGKGALEGMSLLHHLPKKAGEILFKLVKSAVANAENNAKMKPETLYIKEIYVGRGPKLKRTRFVARSRVHGYVKHRSFVKVFLDTK